MMWLIYFISVLLSSLVIYLIWHRWIGFAIAYHLYKFEALYFESFRKSGSTEYSLRHALSVFQGCPRLNKLSNEDFEKFIKILSTQKHPEQIVHKLLMTLNSSKIVLAFRDESLLIKLASMERNSDTTTEPDSMKDLITPCLIELAEKGTDLLNRYFQVDGHIMSQSGTFQSLATHVNFYQLFKEASSLVPIFSDFANDVRIFRDKNREMLSKEHHIFLDNLENYIGALLVTVNCLVDRQRVAYLASEGNLKLTWSEFKKLKTAYDVSIDRYVQAGKTLYDQALKMNIKGL
ncbi:MAG: hypothetical protein V1799_17545 [bacterium]